MPVWHPPGEIRNHWKTVRWHGARRFPVDDSTVVNSAFIRSKTRQCAGIFTLPPMGHDTPVPFNPQYPSGFFARYCW